jgi:transcriptional regulator with XRE-family HTH domain
MSPISKITYDKWLAEKLKDPGFVQADKELEPGYQIARLRIQRGLTQAQLAALVGTKQPSIARLEAGDTLPSLSFLEKVAAVLGARLEISIIPEQPGKVGVYDSR